MLCPFCQKIDTKVVDKRDSSSAIRRRRECLGCGKRFTTYEHVELLNLYVVKKNGSREVFDPEKIKKGMLKACEKRDILIEEVESAVSCIESKIRSHETKEISSSLIGDLVMKHLKRLDKVAYIRFASVYREFTDITSFQEELKQLLKK